MLQKKLLPDLKKKLYPGGNFIFQHDKASSHTSNATQDFLSIKHIDFITKNEWPPNSPDLIKSHGLQHLETPCKEGSTVDDLILIWGKNSIYTDGKKKVCTL